MKKDKKVICILLCTCILIGFCYYIKSFLNGNFSDDKCRGIVESGKYVYFTYYYIADGEIGNGTLVKASKDGKKVLALKNAMAYRLSIYKGKLYYLQAGKLCRINLDGSGYELVDVNIYEDYYVNNGKIYYLKVREKAEGQDIYSCNLNLKNKKAIIKGVDFLKIYKDKIYTGSRRLWDNTITVNECGLSGKFIRKICNIEESIFEVYDGQLFFYPLKMVKVGENKDKGIGTGVYSINIKTGVKKEIIKDNLSSFNIKQGKIYYKAVDINTNVSEGDANQFVYTPYVCNLDGKEKKNQNELSSIIAGISCIEGKSLYYLDEKQNLVVRSINGSKAKIIVPNEKLKNLKAGQ